ncbi:MAG: glycosyltransferase family 4 protein, partial [Candidatus Aenigmatarchaeota archaeon]
QFIHSYVPAARLNKMIAEAKFIVFPYLKSYSGGQSQAIMDAIACAKPVIVSKLPGLTENVIDGKNGLIVSPGDEKRLGDAFLRLSNSSNLLRKISSNNKKLAKALSWKNIARKTIAAYNA